VSPRRKKAKWPEHVEKRARALLAARDADDIRRLEEEALKSVGRRDSKPEKQRGGPSKVERAYAAHLAASANVADYAAQPAPIRLAVGVSYQPDYMVTLRDGDPFYVECKGTKVRRSKQTGRKGKPRPWYHDDGARVKVRWAAQVLATHGIKLLVAFQDPTTKEWIHEEVPA
jgi:hypothetical protein